MKFSQSHANRLHNKKAHLDFLFVAEQMIIAYDSIHLIRSHFYMFASIQQLMDRWIAHRAFDVLSAFMDMTLDNISTQEYRDCVAVLDHLRKRM